MGQDNFKVENNALVNSPGNIAWIWKDFYFKDCEFEFDYEMQGTYWDWQLYQGHKSIGLTFGKTMQGKHHVKLRIVGTKVKVFIDNKENPANDRRGLYMGVKDMVDGKYVYVPKFASALEGMGTIRFQSDGTGIIIKNFKYRPLEKP